MAKKETIQFCGHSVSVGIAQASDMRQAIVHLMPILLDGRMDVGGGRPFIGKAIDGTQCSSGFVDERLSLLDDAKCFVNVFGVFRRKWARGFIE